MTSQRLASNTESIFRFRALLQETVMIWVAIAMLLQGGALAEKLNAAETRPNIVFFLVDDLGWADLGCYGSDYHKTPMIDGLADQGLRFTNAYSACNACSPSRAAIMTGLYPARMRLTDWIPGWRPQPGQKFRSPEWTKHLEHRHTTLAEALKKRGYTTLHVGKWHLGGPDYYPTKHGFDTNIGGSHIGLPRSYHHPYGGSPDIGVKGERGRPYLTDLLTDETLRLINENRNKPFFLNFSYYSVHTPIQPRHDLRENYQQAKRGKVHQNPDYAAMVGAVDESVGRVMKHLKKTGLIDNTIVVFTSDNGGFLSFTSNSPLRGGKGQAWEGGVRVPLIIMAPSMKTAGKTSDEPVISMDLNPSLLELTGDEVTAARGASDGLSLVPLLRDHRASLGRSALFWHYPHYNPCGGVPHSIVRAGRYKLIHFYEGDRIELYDLVNDINEQSELATKMPEKAAELDQALQKWREKVGAQMPIPVAGK